MSFQDLIQKTLSSHAVESINKLQETSSLESLPNEVSELCKVFYNHDTLNCKVAASIINAIFTERKATFLFSRRILDNLIKQDKLIKRNKLNSTTYSNFIKWLISLELLVEVKPSTTTKASVLALNDLNLINAFDKLVGSDYRNAQKDRCIAVYDTLDDSNQSTDLSVDL